MPTYEYRCEQGHKFDRIQKMSERPVTKCPVCGAKASRVISGGQGVIFKGSGFYITDYGKDGKGPRKDADSVPAGESKADAKTESAPASKPEAKADTKGESSSATKPGAAKEAKATPPKPGKSDGS